MCHATRWEQIAAATSHVGFPGNIVPRQAKSDNAATARRACMNKIVVGALIQFDDCCRFFHSRSRAGKAGPDPVWTSASWRKHLCGDFWAIGSVGATLAVSRELKPAFPPKEIDHSRIHRDSTTRVDAANASRYVRQPAVVGVDGDGQTTGHPACGRKFQ